MSASNAGSALKILFICTHNRCRSILAEAVFNSIGKGLLQARSAGSAPEGRVHPLTFAALEAHGIPTIGLASKSWEDMADFAPDVVVTVCDRAANEACPLWFGDTLKLHWGLKDPSTGEGSSTEKLAAFDNTIAVLTRRASAVVELLRNHDRTDLHAVLGQLQTA